MPNAGGVAGRTLELVKPELLISTYRPEASVWVAPANVMDGNVGLEAAII